MSKTPYHNFRVHATTEAQVIIECGHGDYRLEALDGDCGTIGFEFLKFPMDKHWIKCIGNPERQLDLTIKMLPLTAVVNCGDCNVQLSISSKCSSIESLMYEVRDHNCETS